MNNFGRCCGRGLGRRGKSGLGEQHTERGLGKVFGRNCRRKICVSGNSRRNNP